MPDQQRSRSDTAVAVVDDRNLYAESLVTALELEGFVAERVAPEVGAPDEPTRALLVRGRVPDIAVLDADTADPASTPSLLAAALRACRDVVVVTASDDPDATTEWLCAGATVVLEKTEGLARVLSVIDRLRLGEPVLTDAERAVLVHAWEVRRRATHEVRARFARLDRHEAWLLGRLVAGVRVQELTRRKTLPPLEIDRLTTSILVKLEVDSWPEAVSLAIEHEWSPAAVSDQARGQARDPRPEDAGRTGRSDQPTARRRRPPPLPRRRQGSQKPR